MRILRNSQHALFLLTVISLCCLLTSEAGGQDFEGNGRSGALIYNPSPSSGQSYSALSNGIGGFRYTGELFSKGFDILRACDFNGDGKADLVL